jgi:peptidyl-prolyl cis-trans isomerase SurA
MDSIATRPALSATPLTSEGIRRSIQALLENSALTEEAKNLEQEYPEFAALMEEFRDGLMIFRLTDETIWSKLNDTTRARAFYLRNSERYKTQPVIGLSEIFLYKEDDVRQISETLKAHPEAFDTIAAQQTQRPGFREKSGRYAPATPKNAELVRQVLALRSDLREGEILPAIKNGQGWSIIRINSIARPQPMSYDEARLEGAFIDDYQRELEREWLSSLRLKYTVKIDDRALKTALAAPRPQDPKEARATSPQNGMPSQ